MTSHPLEPETGHVYGSTELPMIDKSELEQNLFHYRQEFDYLTIGLREEFEDRITDARLPHEVGMARRQRLNEVALPFLHDKATDFIDHLGPDFRPRQHTLYQKFIDANRQQFYGTVVKNPTLEGMSTRQYPMLATRLQGRYPEVRMARRLFEQLCELPQIPANQQTPLLKAVRDCLIIYGMAMRRPAPGSRRLGNNRPHRIR